MKYLIKNLIDNFMYKIESPKITELSKYIKLKKKSQALKFAASIIKCGLSFWICIFDGRTAVVLITLHIKYTKVTTTVKSRALISILSLQNEGKTLSTVRLNIEL